MEDIGFISLTIIIFNVLFTYQGLKNNLFFENYTFEVDKILINKDYKRLVTSGFLHVSWSHLFFNMLSLYFFSYSLEIVFGVTEFLLIYFGSLIGGDLFSLYIHRNHGDYRSVGASGAISGVIFAVIVLFPGMEIGLFLLPVSIPGWLYGLFFVLISIYGIRSQRDNIGHEAHLGGGLIGLFIAIIIEPNSITMNPLPIVLIVLPSLIFIYFIITKPEFLLVDNLFQKQHKYYTIEDKFNSQRRDRQVELDKLLDKISKSGMNSLSEKEKEKLKRLSSE